MAQFIRIQNFSAADTEVIESELLLEKQVIVQFDNSTYDEGILSELDKLCSKNNKNLCIRFYGHYNYSFDCNTLLSIPHVKCLHIDCLEKADNIHNLKNLLCLEELKLGVFELQETEILNYSNLKNISILSLSETRTKSLNLDYLKDYKYLKSLSIANHTKNIGAIENLTTLEQLSFYYLKKISITFINKLPRLKILSFMLGGRADIHEIINPHIESFKIVRVQGFRDLSNISSFKKLKELSIEDQMQLKEINFNDVFPALTNLRISNCKTFDKITGFKNLPTLKSLTLYGTAIDFDSFIQQPLPDTLEYLGFYTTKAKTDRIIKEVLKKKGYSCR